MRGAEPPSALATDSPGVSTSNVHKSGSGFLPGKFTNGKPGSSNTSASPGMALNGAMSTPAPFKLWNICAVSVRYPPCKGTRVQVVAARVLAECNRPKQSALPLLPEKQRTLSQSMRGLRACNAVGGEMLSQQLAQAMCALMLNPATTSTAGQQHAIAISIYGHLRPALPCAWL